MPLIKKIKKAFVLVCIGHQALMFQQTVVIGYGLSVNSVKGWPNQKLANCEHSSVSEDKWNDNGVLDER